MARISAAENSGHCLRNVEAAVAGEAGQQRVGEAENGRFAAGAHILHRHLSVAAPLPASCRSKTADSAPVAFLPRGCYRRPRF